MKTIRGPYSEKLRISFSDDSPEAAQQQFKDECDINCIMADYKKTGLVSHVSVGNAEYAVTDDLDFHSAMNTIAAGKSLFAQLPAAVRKRFGNDPANFLEFAQKEENHKEMAEMGFFGPDAIPDSGDEPEPLNVEPSGSPTNSIPEGATAPVGDSQPTSGDAGTVNPT